MAELKNLIVNGVARVNGDLYVSDNIYGTASNAISAAYAPFTNTDRYVNTASFASTGSNGANGIKMTLTRAGADTGTVVATIPVASTTAAGVVTGAQVTSWNGAATNSHTHSNKAVLDGITAAKTSSWDAAKPGTVTSIATGTGLTGGPITTTGTMSIAAATLGKIESGSVAFGWGNHASAGYVKTADITTAVNNLVTKSGSTWAADNDTKVTAVGNHYAPTASTEIAASITGSAGAFATNTEYTVLTGIKAKVDAKGHITDIKYTAQKVKDTTIANTDRYVATASFASTGSAGANGVKMTLTRRGSDTGTVVATIPVASATAAGVVTGAQVGKIESGSTAFGWGNHANAGYVKSADITTAINALVTTSGSAWKADTDRYVNTASFASTGSAGANGVKMTLTRRGSDTGTVTATIPVVSATAAGVVTGTQFKKWETGSNWVGANSASLATAITNNHTHSNKALLDSLTNAKTGSWDGKWTYNEATIKAVKVNNATAADSATNATNATNATTATKLAGTSGSLGIPVYVNGGVPTACNANIVSLPLSSSGATTGTLTLVPGKVHKCGTLTGNLTLALGTDNTYTHEAIYCCKFNMGATLRTITLPSGVKVMENSVALDTINRDYEINIMDNIAIIARTEE